MKETPDVMGSRIISRPPRLAFVRRFLCYNPAYLAENLRLITAAFVRFI
ncbi:hypothetical protein BH18ACI2_BH18ACI2_19070 [soil metagenome]